MNGTQSLGVIVVQGVVMVTSLVVVGVLGAIGKIDSAAVVGIVSGILGGTGIAGFHVLQRQVPNISKRTQTIEHPAFGAPASGGTTITTEAGGQPLSPLEPPAETSR